MVDETDDIAVVRPVRPYGDQLVPVALVAAQPSGEQFGNLGFPSAAVAREDHERLGNQGLQKGSGQTFLCYKSALLQSGLKVAFIGWLE